MGVHRDSTSAIHKFQKTYDRMNVWDYMDTVILFGCVGVWCEGEDGDSKVGCVKNAQ
jgi:hypothetical protein